MTAPQPAPAPVVGFEVQSDACDGQVVLRLVGELDCATAPRLEDAVDRFGAQGVPRLVFDLSALRFIDSSGLHQFVRAHKRQRDAGGELVLRAPTANTMRVLDIAGLSNVMTID